MTDDQQAFLDKLVLFAKTGDPEHIGRADLSDGEVKALMLLVTMYSNKLSLDMRLISPAYADSPGNKASRSAANIAEYYRRYEDQKGTQMVFCDLSTYKPDLERLFGDQTQTGREARYSGAGDPLRTGSRERQGAAGDV